MSALRKRLLLFRSGRHLQVALDALEAAWPGTEVTVVTAPSGVAALEQAGIGPNRRIVYDRTYFFRPLQFLTSAAGAQALAGRYDQVAVLWNDPVGTGSGNVDRTALCVSPRGFVAITPNGALVARRAWPNVSRELKRAGWSLAVGAALFLALYLPATLLRPIRRRPQPRRPTSDEDGLTRASAAPRFAFGKNWTTFIDKHFTEERVQIAQDHLLGFLRLGHLSGRRMIDIGCGSGLHALAAVRANVDELRCFDYDANSVSATRRLHAMSGSPTHWRIEQGSILDRAYVSSLGQYDVVYSWGVLHHTGDQWTAFRNAASLIAPGGVFYVALYTSDAFINPPPEYWLDLKRRYNHGGWFVKRKLEFAYAYDHLRGLAISGKNPVAFVLGYKKSRGMSYFTDVRDWVGGWPMEFSAIQDVKDFGSELGLELVNITTGHANTEYLFRRPGR